MSDGREEREERKQRIEEAKKQNREDLIPAEYYDEGQPERQES